MKTYQLKKSHIRTHWGVSLLLAITCFHPTIALAQLTAPATSTGTYTVSWTEQSGGQTRAYLYERENQDRWKKTTVTGTNRRTFTKPLHFLRYRIR